MAPPADEPKYLYRLEPPTNEGPFQAEQELLRTLENLREQHPLHRYQVHVYEGQIDEAHHLGTDEAVVIWILKEVDLNRFDGSSTKDRER